MGQSEGGPDRPHFFTLVHSDHASGTRLRPLISTTRVQSFAPARAHGLSVQNRTDLPDTIHLKIAGRIVFFMIASGYPPPSAKVATQPGGVALLSG